MHADREAACAGIDIITNESALTGFVPATLVIEREWQGRDYLPGAQMGL
jgi:hypothetical protein